MKNVIEYYTFINESSDSEFIKLRDKYIKQEEEVAEKVAEENPDHPFLKKYWVKLAKLKTMTDPQKFLRAYKKLRGISKLDLDDELFVYWKDKKEIKKEKKEEKKQLKVKEREAVKEQALKAKKDAREAAKEEKEVETTETE